MTYIAVDPVTRAEGLVRIEAEVDGGKRNGAWSVHTTEAGRRELTRAKGL